MGHGNHAHTQSVTVVAWAAHLHALSSRALPHELLLPHQNHTVTPLLLFTARLHDHLLDRGHTRGGLCLTSVLVLVALEGGVIARGAGVALLGALRRVLGRTALGALRGVRILSLGSVVVAVGEREVRAKAGAKWAGTFVLTARDGALLLDVAPGG